MKKILFSLILIGVFIGCEKPTGTRNKKDGYAVIIIDSCEYIEVSYLLGTDYGYYSLTHKGNCKNHK